MNDVEEMEVVLPKLGESIHEASIVRWLKKEGESVRRDEPLVEVATDKVASEIPAPISGVLTKICALPSHTYGIGDILCLIQKEETPFYSPALLRFAEEKGLSLSRLSEIAGTGEGGRLTKRDVEEFLLHTNQPSKDSNRLVMSPVRKAIGDLVQKSHREIPAGYFITEIDVTDLMKMIQHARHEKKVKLTLTAVIGEAIKDAVKTYPHINAKIEGDAIVLRDEVHLGIAMNIDDEVYLPVVSNVHNLSKEEIAHKIHDLREKGEKHLFEKKDLEGATISLTNFGMGHIQIGIPIIPYGQIAIIGVGTITKKPMVVQNDQIAIRSTLFLSLSFDHRAIDGMYASRFLYAIKHALESY